MYYYITLNYKNVIVDALFISIVPSPNIGSIRPLRGLFVYITCVYVLLSVSNIKITPHHSRPDQYQYIGIATAW